jgi:hypothetical protein
MAARELSQKDVVGVESLGEGAYVSYGSGITSAGVFLDLTVDFEVGKTCQFQDSAEILR